MQNETVTEKPPESAPEAPPEKPRKPGMRKKKKLMIAVIAIIVAVVIIYLGWSSTGGRNYISVAEIVDDEANIANNVSKYQEDVIEVKGRVIDYTAGELEFTLVDEVDVNKTIAIIFSGTIPDNFENGKTVAVKGQLRDNTPITLDATAITIGCASKY